MYPNHTHNGGLSIVSSCLDNISSLEYKAVIILKTDASWCEHNGSTVRDNGTRTTRYMLFKLRRCFITSPLRVSF